MPRARVQSDIDAHDRVRRAFAFSAQWVRGLARKGVGLPHQLPMPHVLARLGVSQCQGNAGQPGVREH